MKVTGYSIHFGIFIPFPIKNGLKYINATIPKKNYREFQVRPYHAAAAIVNFKKDVADDVSLVAPLSRILFCQKKTSAISNFSYKEKTRFK